ncbi:MAG TPA: lysophospholipid acyltransferase family protein [Capsulimonadaceae bacterium]|jgi:hypothetical protein
MAEQLRLKDKLITFSAYWTARALASTVRVDAYGEEYLLNLKNDNGESVILLGWHGGTFLPINRYRNRGYWAMISTSRDGDRQNNLFHRFGFRTVRGSTSARGAVESVIAMRRELKKGGVLAHTPDGPRGPHGVVHPGAIYIAQKSGCPVVPVGVGSWPRWNLSTWDHYTIPKPFARGVMLYGDPITVPSDLDDTSRKAFADAIGERIHTLQALADEMVEKRIVPDLAELHEPFVFDATAGSVDGVSKSGKKFAAVLQSQLANVELTSAPILGVGNDGSAEAT